MTRLILALAACGALAGCVTTFDNPRTHKPFAECYTGLYTCFCALHKDTDDGVVGACSPIVPTANSAAGLVTEGAVLAK